MATPRGGLCGVEVNTPIIWLFSSCYDMTRRRDRERDGELKYGLARWLHWDGMGTQ